MRVVGTIFQVLQMALFMASCATASSPDRTVRTPIDQSPQEYQSRDYEKGKMAETGSSTVQSYLRQTPSLVGARLFGLSDVKNPVEQLWFEKNGYTNTVVFEMDFGDASQIAAVIIAGSDLQLLIIRVEGEKMSELYRQSLNMKQAMLKLELMPGVSRSICILASAGPKGPRTAVCWNGQKFVGI